MTTNQPLYQFQIELEKAKRKDIHIEIESTIGTSINYLDLMIKNDNGQLRTYVYHKPTSDPYYLPYHSEHPHQYHRNIPYSALVRATRLCSHIDDFNSERLRIEISLLLSQYPPKFITNHFLRFFQVNKAEDLLLYLDQQMYQQIRKHLLQKVKRKETKIQHCKNHPITNPTILQPKLWDKTKMYPRYTYQTGFKNKFPSKFYSWWQKHYYYQGSPAKHIKISLKPTLNRTLARTLIRKKPLEDILRRMPPK